MNTRYDLQEPIEDHFFECNRSGSVEPSIFAIIKNRARSTIKRAASAVLLWDDQQNDAVSIVDSGYEPTEDDVTNMQNSMKTVLESEGARRAEMDKEQAELQRIADAELSRFNRDRLQAVYEWYMEFKQQSDLGSQALQTLAVMQEMVIEYIEMSYASRMKNIEHQLVNDANLKNAPDEALMKQYIEVISQKKKEIEEVFVSGVDVMYHMRRE